MKQNQYVTSGNVTFSGKEIFCKIYSCSINSLDQYVTNVTENGPLTEFFHMYYSTELNKNTCQRRI